MDVAKEKSTWKQKLKREFVRYWINVAYLSATFGIFAWYRRLILAQHEIVYLRYGVAIFEAMVLAKVIMIGEVLGLSREFFKEKALIYPTLFKSLLYTLFVGIFVVIEATITGMFKGQGLAGWINEMRDEGKFEFLAHCLMVFFVFIPFFAFRELGRMLGISRLSRLFFRDGQLPAT